MENFVTKLIINDREYIIDIDIKLNFDDALLYCKMFNVDGQHDWRMATKKDIGILYESKLYQVDFVGWVEDDEYNAASYFVNSDELYFSELNPEYVGFPVAIVRDICI
jgi:hypothetical protein